MSPRAAAAPGDGISPASIARRAMTIKPQSTGPTRAQIHYGYLGAKQRNTTLPSGAIEMGARLYVPQLGRFLQPDPIYGGSANPYEYALQDPVNRSDLDGRCPVCVVILGVEVSPYVAAAVGAAVAVVAGRAIANAVKEEGLPDIPEMFRFSRGKSDKGPVSGAAGKAPKLSEAEAQAIANAKQGKPADRRALKSAQQKIKQAQKYQSTRHSTEKKRKK